MSLQDTPPVKSARDPRKTWAQVPSIAIADPRLNDAAFRLYALILDTINTRDAEPTFWMSRANMAARLGKSASSVKSMDKAMDMLIAAGYVHVIDERYGQTTKYGLIKPSKLDLTYGQTTTGSDLDTSEPMAERPHPPMVKRPHYQEPLTKNQSSCCLQANLKLSKELSKPEPRSPQGVVKDGPEEARSMNSITPTVSTSPVTSSKNDEQHKRADRVTQRVIRLGMRVGGFRNRKDVSDWLTMNRAYEPVSAIGSRKMIDYWGALRRLVAGFDGVECHSDTAIIELIAHAKSTPTGMDWLVEYVRGLQRAALGVGDSTAEMSAVWVEGDPQDAPAWAV